MLERDTAMTMLAEGEYVWDIGQLAPRTRRLLNRMAKEGKIVRVRAMWPWFHVGIAPKTVYLAKERAV